MRPCISTIATQDNAVIKMVEQGMGCSILSELVLRGATDHVTLAPIDPPAYREIGAAVARGRKPSPVIRAFLTCLREDVRQSAPNPV